MELPESIVDAVKKGTNRYPDNVKKATDHANMLCQKLPEFTEWIEDLAWCALQDQVYEVRHTMNRAKREELGCYGGPAKVVSGSGKGVDRAARSVYLYHIAGKTLGNLFGEDLLNLSKTQMETSKGYVFNSRLLAKLHKMVPKTKQVREVVSEKKLKALFQEVGGETWGEAS